MRGCMVVYGIGAHWRTIVVAKYCRHVSIVFCAYQYDNDTKLVTSIVELVASVELSHHFDAARSLVSWGEMTRKDGCCCLPLRPVIGWTRAHQPFGLGTRSSAYHFPVSNAFWSN